MSIYEFWSDPIGDAAEDARREQAAQRDLLEWAEADAKSNDDMRVQLIDENIRLEAENERLRSLLAAGEAFLNCIDNITSDSFSKGGERAEREAFRAAIEAAKEATK